MSRFTHVFGKAPMDGGGGFAADSEVILDTLPDAEEALRASRVWLNRPLRQGKTGSWEWDVAAGTMHWAEETYKLHGFNPGDFSPGSDEHIRLSLVCYAPSDEALVYGAFRRCVEKGEPYDLEVPFTTHDGRNIWVRTGAEPIRDGSGKVTRVVGYITDVTLLRETEAALRKSEEKYRVLMNEAAEMLFLHDFEGRIHDVNRAAVEGTGYTREELLGLSVHDLDHEVAASQEIDQILDGIRQGSRACFHTRLCRKDGTSYPAEVRLGKVSFDSQEYILSLASDISERKRYDQAVEEKTALENQLHHLQKADSINRMAGAVAHHFNNKLCGVLASLELVRMQTVEGGGGTEMIDIAIEAATKASDISQLMLTCLGQSRLERCHVDLAALCRELRPSLASSMPATVLLDLCLPDESMAVWADAEALRHIVGHLVANAWEAEGTTHVGLRVARIRPDASGSGVRYPMDWVPADSAFVVIEVTDDGAGMSATMVEQIFDPFFSTKFTGRGIGLPLVLGLARSHGGGVIVESKAGEGTVFRVCLPAAGDVTVAAGATLAPSPADGPDAVTVLLVEDEAPLRELAGMMIQSLGGRVISACNGKEALQKFEQNRAAIDLVFCDIRMPGIDGWQVLTKLRKADPTLPVVFATAYDDAAVAPDGQTEQPDAILRKPYLLKDVQGVLERFGGK